jgi:hypothetical protein
MALIVRLLRLRRLPAAALLTLGRAAVACIHPRPRLFMADSAR